MVQLTKCFRKCKYGWKLAGKRTVCLESGMDVTIETQTASCNSLFVSPDFSCHLPCLTSSDMRVDLASLLSPFSEAAQIYSNFMTGLNCQKSRAGTPRQCQKVGTMAPGSHPSSKHSCILPTAAPWRDERVTHIATLVEESSVKYFLIWLLNLEKIIFFI